MKIFSKIMAYCSGSAIVAIIMDTHVRLVGSVGITCLAIIAIVSGAISVMTYTPARKTSPTIVHRPRHR